MKGPSVNQSKLIDEAIDFSTSEIVVYLALDLECLSLGNICIT